MKFKVIFLFITLAATQSLFAQFDCSAFYPFEQGVTFEYASYNQKGKLESTTESVVKMIKELPNGVEAVVASTIRDKKEKEQFSGEYTIRCEDGKLYMDVNSMLDPAMKESFSNMEVTIEGDELILPNELKAGQRLPDASTTIRAGTGGINIINMTVRIVDRKVEGQEEVTTPAGTFPCYKISQTTDVKMMIAKSFRTVEYYAEGIGVVRSETYDKKGNLDSYMELTKFEE